MIKIKIDLNKHKTQIFIIIQCQAFNLVHFATKKIIITHLQIKLKILSINSKNNLPKLLLISCK